MEQNETLHCLIMIQRTKAVLQACEIQGAKLVIQMKKARFSSRPGGKVRCQGPPRSTTLQPCDLAVLIMH